MKNERKRKDSYVPLIEASIIGCVAGLSAVVLSAGVNWLGALRVHLSNNTSHLFVLPLFGLIGGLTAGLLVQTVAPEASGSGIPQVKARLDRVTMPLNIRIALVKLIGGTIALGSGLFMGREGPTVQLGASVAAPLSRFFPTSSQHKRQLIAAGAGAGLTAAFNAPLAGVTFVLEELLKEVRPDTVMISVVACSMSCFVLNMLAPQHSHAANQRFIPSVTFNHVDLPWYLLLGAAAGLLSAIFNKAVLGSLNFYGQVMRLPVTLRVGMAGLVSGWIISVMPLVFHDFAGMRELIISGETQYQTVLVAFVEFYLLTLIAYGSGAPGGLFAPSLALGASLGFLMGCLEVAVTGSGSPAAFALVGMGAFFAGVARTPLTALVITFELTSNFDLLVPLMFCCVISTAVAELAFKGGLYEHLMRWNGIHLRGPGTSESLRVLTANDVMHKKFKSFENQSPLKNVLSTFGSVAQRGFPVVRKGILVGVVTQADLSKLDKTELLDSTTVSDIMTPQPVAVNGLDTLDDILFLFSQHKFTWLPVVEHDKLIGIILQSDVLKALFEFESMLPSQAHEDSGSEQLDQKIETGVGP